VEILQNTSPSNYGVEDIKTDAGADDIWVDIPKRTFTIKNVELMFSARLGGSNERNGYDAYFSKIISGDGQFDFNVGNDIEIIALSINEDLDLYPKSE
jgi:hypothetical protein